MNFNGAFLQSEPKTDGERTETTHVSKEPLQIVNKNQSANVTPMCGIMTGR